MVHPAGRGESAGMLSVNWDTIRLFLHVLAATVWVGGQITLAVLVPVLRRAGTDIPRAAARRFNQVAWPAFGILVITSGVTAALHARARSPAGLAIFGALTGVSALAALFLGILLAG